MGAIYIGGQNRKSGGSSWKIYFYLIIFFGVIGTGLKYAGPTIVERWINQNGANSKGYVYSVRDVELALGEGKMILKDVKVFNKETSAELLEAPSLTLQINLQDLLMSQDKKIAVVADQIDVILSKDFSAEMERIKTASKNQDLYLDAVDGKIGKLNIIQQNEDESRTVLELKDVNLKVKEVSLRSINKKTEFSVSSNIAEGGKLNLTGKTNEENGSTPWSIQGSLKQVPSDIFNKMAGDKLPFSFNETNLNAEISAHSDNGKVSGEFSPDITKLNVLVEKPGVPTQSIKRVLNDEVTFSLPFTLKDELRLQYADVFQKLKNYRRYPAATGSSEPPEAKVTQAAPKVKKAFSFWPF